MSKISIRFFDDREVRAVWDEEQAKWWFSVVDIVGVLNDEDDYTKAGNYWRWLKRKLLKEEVQFVSGTHRLKLTAADGKKYLTDTLDSDGIVALAKHFPNNKATWFLDWFLYSENSLDGQSKKKAYALFEGGLIDNIEVGTAKGLQQIHAYLFGGLYPFAGQIRQKNISKGAFQFATSRFLGATLQQIDAMPEDSFDQIVAKYVDMNVAHPFMEGNGRSTRIWFDLILKKRLKRCVDWSRIGKKDYMNAMVQSSVDSRILRKLLKYALTDEIDSREMHIGHRPLVVLRGVVIGNSRITHVHERRRQANGAMRARAHVDFQFATSASINSPTTPASGRLPQLHPSARATHAAATCLRCFSMKALLLLTMLCLLCSCASSHTVRKCDGRRGERVPMGVL